MHVLPCLNILFVLYLLKNVETFFAGECSIYLGSLLSSKMNADKVAGQS